MPPTNGIKNGLNRLSSAVSRMGMIRKKQPARWFRARMLAPCDVTPCSGSGHAVGWVLGWPGASRACLQCCRADPAGVAEFAGVAIPEVIAGPPSRRRGALARA